MRKLANKNWFVQEGIRERLSGADGFTLIEMLVSIAILAVILAGMFGFLWGVSKSWQKGQDVADVTENARQGLNRMTRELRQSSQVVTAQESEVAFEVNFGDGPETITYGFSPGEGGSPGTVWRTSTSSPGQFTLINNVNSVRFTYYGNDYRCDFNGDGVITLQELEQPSCNGNPSKIARVDINLTLSAGKENAQTFIDQAWLRNRTV